MAKKKNLVGGAKVKISLMLTAGMIAGWGICGYAVILQNGVRKQNAMVENAESFLPDKLYIRAANGYKEALKTYSTKNNLTYERRLLDIYDEAGMEDEYADLVDDRIEAKTALVDEYQSRAETLIGEDNIKKAITILKQGIEIYGDSQLVELCESIKYQTRENGTNYQEGKLPSDNWIIPMWNGEKWGYTGKNGRTSLDFIYDEATRFSGNYAVVKLDGVYTLIDQNGYWNAVDKNGLDEVTEIAGTRIIPLVIEEEKMQKACEVAGKEPIFRILPYQKKKAGIVTTGSEVYYHRIEDKFTPVVIEKLKECGVTEVKQIQCNDDHEMITEAIQTLIEDGSDLIVCTGGMSVDPDDRTPLAIKNACTEVVTYGAPVLPGAMFMLAYCEKEGRQIPVMGLPGCVMYAKRTIFDLVLPRIMCDEKLHEKDFRLLGQGGLCLSCPVCTFPNCGFGKGGY